MRSNGLDLSKPFNIIIMKYLFILFSITALSFASCREQKKETVIREVRVEKESTPAPERKGAFERAAEKIDKKIDKKIDEKIDEID